ncbi:alpha-galactosidase [Aestuariibaculum sediminum]|uniref:Alpha-galactosidase n=1 Tax=Aestuariibaculum sediminum TaxID=2770637 RepID=A0A8J6Q279_9FLAO|nr:alpha-galactosidase [Aestuariibaculum sediminum]MBD0833407.1 alpha-galactosidase [Aestuariibaculum sediminum]
MSQFAKVVYIIVLSLIVFACSEKQNEYILENDYLSRCISIKDGYLVTTKIQNKINGQSLTPEAAKEFKIRVSKGTDKVGGDIILTSKDFKVENVSELKTGDGQKLVVNVSNEENNLKVAVQYELGNEQPYIHKYLTIIANEELTLERIDVEAIDAKGAYQPYKLKEITTRAAANWKPGLGQPLYDTETATFWGTEFPASTNLVINQDLNCGYLWGNTLKKGQEYTSYKSVVGVADDYKFIDEAFYDYINQIRVRPLRLQVQYNSWFDFYTGVNKDNFKASVLKVNDELVNKRNVTPLKAYVIDDGWQDSRRPESDWSDQVWKVNNKFSSNLADTHKTVDSLGAMLGVWLSPASILGALPMVEKMGNQGFEKLGRSMSMTGPKYMQRLEDRILELEKDGVCYFKFDGLFGHLNIRDFELKGRGTPAMPQLDVENLIENDSVLSDPKYDELKTYYLVNGTERLMSIFKKMATVNPDVFIAITNGAYLSPWWLQYIDVVWMINAGDAAEGGTRTDELVYRDGIYYEIWKEEETKFPMNALFNHEPKKVKTGESKEAFKDYLLMNISRGTGFIELYLKTDVLSNADWDVLAEGLKWSEQVFPLFTNVKMHGGNPKNLDVYGYSAWKDHSGYVSIHNPSNQTKTYTLKLDRILGVKEDGTYNVSSPIESDLKQLENTYTSGDTITISLEPKEIRILNFN